MNCCQKQAIAFYFHKITLQRSLDYFGSWRFTKSGHAGRGEVTGDPWAGIDNGRECVGEAVKEWNTSQNSKLVSHELFFLDIANVGSSWEERRLSQ
jgi:hypothetical protein